MLLLNPYQRSAHGRPVAGVGRSLRYSFLVPPAKYRGGGEQKRRDLDSRLCETQRFSFASSWDKQFSVAVRLKPVPASGGPILASGGVRLNWRELFFGEARQPKLLAEQSTEEGQ